MSYRCKCKIITITRRSKFDVDANQQQEVLLLTPSDSCAAAVDVLINGQALPTKAQRSALTRFAMCPLLDLLLLTPIKSLRALAELSSRCFQAPPLMPSSIRVRKLLLRRGNIHPTLLRSSRPKLDIGEPTISTRDSYHNIPYIAARRSDRGHDTVTQLVLRDDWNPSQYESC